MSECLDDDVLAAFATGGLSEQTRAAVLQHVDHCEECLASLSDAARDGKGDRTTEDRALCRGDRIGRYELLEIIGQGSMGTVFEAHDTQLDRRVALKVVRSTRVTDATTRERLSREARAMAKVAHPNVVTVFDAGEEAGLLYIAMERVQGTTLRRWLEERPRTLREIVDVHLAAGRGLAEAHAVGVVHRDFKPDNVLVDARGRVAVTDFGLAFARPSAPLRDEDRALPTEGRWAVTQRGVVLGTPAYMAPEQYLGAKVDARSDQFSFAVAAWEALCGERPFAGATLGALRDAVVGGRVRAPSKKMPTALDSTLRRALSADPARRFDDMHALLDALQRATKPRSTRSAWIFGLFAIGAALVIVPLARKKSPTPSPVPSTSVSGVAAASRARATVLVAPLDDRSGLAELSGALEAMIAATLHRSTRIDASVGKADASADDFVVTSSALAAADGIRLSVELRRAAGAPTASLRATAKDARALPATVIDLARKLRLALGDSPADVDEREDFSATALSTIADWVRGDALISSGDLRGAVTQLRRCVDDDPSFAEAHASLGIALFDMTEIVQSTSELQAAIARADVLGERRKLKLLGDYYGAIGDSSASIAAYQLLLTRWPGDRAAEINATATAIEGGQWPLAIELARRAATDRPHDVTARANVLLALIGRGALDEARAEADALLAEFPNGSRYAFAFAAIARALSDDRAGALAVFDRMQSIAPEDADENRADFALYEGRLDDADALLSKWIDDAMAHETPTNARTEFVKRALLRLRRGDAKGALADARAAAVKVETSDARLQYLVFRTLVLAGDPAAARATIDEWSNGPSTTLRAYAKSLQAEIARAAGKMREAIALYTEGAHLQDLWVMHERLGSVLLATNDWAAAERELSICDARRGEGAVFATPSTALLPEVSFGLARAMEGAGETERALDAYRRLLATSPSPQGDPLTREAAQRAHEITEKTGMK